MLLYFLSLMSKAQIGRLIEAAVLCITLELFGARRWLTGRKRK